MHGVHLSHRMNCCNGLQSGHKHFYMFFKKLFLPLAITGCICLSLGLSANAASTKNAPVTATAVRVIPSSSIVFIKENTYEVKPGDNTWNLSKDWYYDGYQWGQIVEQNPFLREPGRIRYDSITKMVYCRIEPGETLVHYNQVLPLIDTIPKTDTASHRQTIIGTTYPESWNWNFWGPVIIIAMILLAAILFFRYSPRKSEANPETDGAPQVKGGIQPTQAPTRAAQIAQSMNGANINSLRVTNIIRGRFFGKGRVFYADKPTGQIKKFDGEVGYRGEVQVGSSGITNTVYFLQACGNDVRQGSYMTGINFVPDMDQPEALVTHNATVSSNESNSPQNEPFLWQKVTLEIIKKAVDDGKSIYFEFTQGDAKFKFDSVPKQKETKPNQGTESKQQEKKNQQG